ncbi:AraC family transcriptional regulator [Paenibacillus abyssi]|uniref:HTH-type transcriptional regulator YesS n=1 Tax=Paenibacillus abyssi TaxID=1340531 RepID=A0A917FU16_9BACL|nr:AraC family transcriptional regulator [Paenibacillus abyssi]GGG01285.1 HTH-type transcriptional regulator YesS [Paenibacillus abyssi]
MGFLGRFRNYRVYRKLLLSYVLLIVITISLVTTILYFLFSAKAVQEIDDSSQKMLSQVSYTANVVFKQIEIITNQLLNDSQVTMFLYANNDKIVNYNVKLLLSKVQSVYPFISNISLYNFENGNYIDATGQSKDPNLPAPQHVQYFQFYPRQIEQVNEQMNRLLTFKIIPLPSFTGDSKSAIVLDLEEAYIQNTMRSISSSSPHTSTFVMDNRGIVLSHSNAAYFMNDVSDEEYVQTIIDGTSDQGSIESTINKKKYLITYVKSSTLDWYFVSVRPYNELFSNIYELRNWTLLVAVILCVIGGVIALVVTGNLYNPIKALVDKVSERGVTAKNASLLRLDEYNLLSEVFTNTLASAKTLENNLMRSTQAMKNSYMFNLLKGNSNESYFSPDIEQKWQNELKGPYLLAILIKIDSFQAFKLKYNAIDRGLVRFAVSNIAHELVNKVYPNEIAMIEEEETALIVQMPHSEFGEALYLTLAEIQETIQNYYKISVSVSIGDPCTHFLDIRNSYQSAQLYMKQRLFWGNGSILDATKARREQELPSRYPISSERKLIDVIKLCQPKSIQREIDDWIVHLSNNSYSQAIQYTNFLFLAIIREFETMTEWWGLDPNELYTAMNDVHAAETLEEIRKRLKDFCFRIMSMIEENKNNLTTVKIAKVIEEVKQYLHAKYTDPGISLESASDHVELSSGYIGKLFKTVTGSSFNDYVTSIRMEKAKELLLETSYTVAQIGERVGIYNVSYFSTLFKKKHGMTPSQFREQPRGE